MDIPILATSPDGRFKVCKAQYESGGRSWLTNERICLLEEGREPRSLTPHLNWDVMCAAFSASGVLAIGLEPHPELYPYVERLDETIAILDIDRDGEFAFIRREVELRNAPSVRALTFSGDGTLLVAGGRHGVTIWEMASRAIVREIAPENHGAKCVTTVAISPDGGMVAFARKTGAVMLSPTHGGRKPFTLIADTNGDGVDAIGFPDPMTVAIAFADGSVRRWNAQSGRELPPSVKGQGGRDHGR